MRYFNKQEKKKTERQKEVTEKTTCTKKKTYQPWKDISTIERNK